MRPFPTPLRFVNTGRQSHGRPVLRLTSPLEYYPGRGFEPVRVPAGLETDLASVPRFFWRVAAPWDALEPPAVHDWLYRRAAEYPRWMADLIFLLALRDAGVARWRSVAMYLAVRAFGRSAYHAQ